MHVHCEVTGVWNAVCRPLLEVAVSAVEELDSSLSRELLDKVLLQCSDIVNQRSQFRVELEGSMVHCERGNSQESLPEQAESGLSRPAVLSGYVLHWGRVGRSHTAEEPTRGVLHEFERVDCIHGLIEL